MLGIGTSGWLYPPWRGVFYPKGLPHRREREYLSSRLTSVEINGTFYSLQRPDSFRRWHDETPNEFTFAVKGPRFVTHMKKLDDVDTPLANFFANGLLALADKLGPVLWQLPPTLGYDRDRLAAFFARLPRSTDEAAWLARRHDDRVDGRSLTDPVTQCRVRHALEVRNRTYVTPEFLELLREHHIAVVVADREWTASGHDVQVHFDNDVKVHAPFDAMQLAQRLGVATRSA